MNWNKWSFRWPGGSAVSELDLRPKGPRFNSQLVHYQVKTLGKLFTPTCLLSIGWCRPITFRFRFDSNCWSFASNLEQITNLLCAQANSASYPLCNGKWVLTYGLRRKKPRMANWGSGMFADCKLWVQLFAYRMFKRSSKRPPPLQHMAANVQQTSSKLPANVQH